MQCEINARDLWDEDLHETIFYDMYIEFEVAGAQQLYAVPILITNYQDSSGKEANKGTVTLGLQSPNITVHA